MPVYCKRCRQKLTTPKSIKRGFGPVCYKKMIDDLWESTERDMPLEPKQIGQTIFTKNTKDTLKALKTAGKYDAIIQDEELKIIGNGNSREQDATDKIIRKMR